MKELIDGASDVATRVRTAQGDAEFVAPELTAAIR